MEEELCQELSDSIGKGDSKKAAEIAVRLASAKCAVKVIENDIDTQGKVILHVYLQCLEKRSEAPLILLVQPSDTIAILKHTMSNDFGLDQKRQRWFLDDLMVQDGKKVADMLGGEVTLYMAKFPVTDWRCSVCGGANESQMLNCQTCLQKRA